MGTIINGKELGAACRLAKKAGAFSLVRVRGIGDVLELQAPLGDGGSLSLGIGTTGPGYLELGCVGIPLSSLAKAAATFRSMTVELDDARWLVLRDTDTDASGYVQAEASPVLGPWEDAPEAFPLASAPLILGACLDVLCAVAKPGKYRPALESVGVRGAHAMATDGKRGKVSRIGLTVASPLPEFTVPPLLFKLTGQAKRASRGVSIAVGSGSVVFRADDTAPRLCSMVLVHRTVDGFPFDDLARLVKGSYSARVGVVASELKRVLRFVRIAGRASKADTKARIAFVTIEAGGGLVVRANGHEIECRASVDPVSGLEGTGAVTVGLDLRFVLDAIKGIAKHATVTVQATDEGSPADIAGTLVMPCRMDGMS